MGPFCSISHPRTAHPPHSLSPVLACLPGTQADLHDTLLLLWVGNDAFPRRASHVEGLGWFQRVVLLDDENINFNGSTPWQIHGLMVALLGGRVSLEGIVTEGYLWRGHILCPLWVEWLWSTLAKWSWSDTSENMSKDKPFKFFIEGIVVPVTKINSPYLSVQNLDFTAPTRGFKGQA